MFERCAGAAIVLGGWGREYFTYLGDLRVRGSWRFGFFGGLRDGVWHGLVRAVMADES